MSALNKILVLVLCFLLFVLGDAGKGKKLTSSKYPPRRDARKKGKQEVSEDDD